jgi:hypothetical protein
MFREYTRVVLTTAKYVRGGAVPGMVGLVLESYEDGRYEVEFSDSSGRTVAQMVVSERDLIPIAPECGDA